MMREHEIILWKNAYCQWVEGFDTGCDSVRELRKNEWTRQAKATR